MPATRKTIPIHKLEESTDQGFQIEKVDSSNEATNDAKLMGAHRDDHYIFLLQERGRSKCMVDFQVFTLQKNTLLFVLPGQVHRYIDSDKAMEGWFVALDAGLVPEPFRSTLGDPLLSKKPLSPDVSTLEPLLQCLRLIYGITRQQPALPYSRQIVHGLLTSFVALVAAVYTQQSGCPSEDRSKDLWEKVPRSLAITQSFRKSLSLRYKTCKNPAEYAAALNLSLSYLNEVVKATTGFPVSYWIQQEIVLEAKRLLYYSDCSVKEIAHELGYEDHTYFSRLFKKTVSLTPGEFRRRYRE
ncbi:MAG TPA: helix-turn-helix transcriptional regulator [Puia sp.]|nr:helix-turn-helix transcriptional regulator [Puia sp.]